MTGFGVKPLDETTWMDFARLVEKHNGVWGGTVESYPEGVDGRSVSASFLHNATLSTFEHQGFERTRRLGKNHWVVTKVVRGPSTRRPRERPSLSPSIE